MPTVARLASGDSAIRRINACCNQPMGRAREEREGGGWWEHLKTCKYWLASIKYLKKDHCITNLRCRFRIRVPRAVYIHDVREFSGSSE